MTTSDDETMLLMKTVGWGERQTKRDLDQLSKLKTSLTWVKDICPGKNSESGGAIVHMTWQEWNSLRAALGLPEQSVPSRASQTVRIVKARSLKPE